MEEIVPLKQGQNSMATSALQRSAAEGQPAVGIEPRQFRPVAFWAWIGAIFAGILFWALAMWVIEGDFKSVPTGPTPVPTYMLVFARVWEVVAVVSTLIFLYVCLVRPWRRERRFSFDGMFCIAALLVYGTQDLSLNYMRPFGLYNSVFVNRGSWFCHIPGWTSPNGCKQAEPLLAAWLLYPIVLLGFAMLGCAFLRKVQARWPKIGKGGLVACCFAFAVLTDVVMEVIFLTTGFYHYAGSKAGLTLFHGHYYQYPIYEGLFWGAFWTAVVCMRFFKDDKGLSWVERGLDRVSVRRSAKPWVTMLALLGAMNAFYIGLFAVPYNAISGHMGAWPEDIVSRSYMTNGVCGPGTEHACPGPAVPIPTPHSVHMNPEGDISIPEGTKLPKPVASQR